MTNRKGQRSKARKHDDGDADEWNNTQQIWFTIKTPLKTHSLLALTMIDPATGWFEIAEANNKSAASIQDLFHNTWVARSPCPLVEKIKI